MFFLKYRPSGVVVVLSAVGASVGAIVLFKDLAINDKYKGQERIAGKTVIVTGANCGLGKATTKELAKRGGRIIMACRNLKKCEEARKEIVDATHNLNVQCKKLDLSSIKSIKEFAKDINDNEKRLDILINNAAVMGLPKREVTEDGFEKMLGVNYLGPFLLTNMLLKKMQQSAIPICPSRVINLMSPSYIHGKMTFEDLNWINTTYDFEAIYAQSKLALQIFTLDLARRTKGTGVNIFSVNPDLTRTSLGRHMSFAKSTMSSFILYPFVWLVTKSPEQGIHSIIQCVLDPDLEDRTGLYIRNGIDCDVRDVAKDEETTKRLWLTSEKWMHLDKK